MSRWFPWRRAIAMVATATMACGLMVVGVVTGASPAAAWTSGVCPDGNGVTVVVDFQDLGGGTVTRCADVSAGAKGVDALKKAGFSVTGTTRYGLAFVCRINNRPGPEENLKVPGSDAYREDCQDTPKGAFWSYWSAPNGGSWSVQSFGASSRQVVIGGFEGWSFSTGASSPSNPPPRQAPSRPTGAVNPAQPGGQAGAGAGAGAAGAGGAQGSGNSSGRGSAGGGGAPDGKVAAGDNGSEAAESSNEGDNSEGQGVDESMPETPGETDQATESGRPDGAASATSSSGTNAQGSSVGSGGGIPVGTALGIGAVVLVASAAVTTAIMRRRTTANGPSR